MCFGRVLCVCIDFFLFSLELRRSHMAYTADNNYFDRD